MTRETSEQALTRIQNGFSGNDILSVYYFAACGVPAESVVPRENVLTFNAWKAKGRSVAKGAKGLPLTVWISVADKNGDDSKRIPRTTRVFHESQTVPQGDKEAVPEAAGNEFLIDAEQTAGDKRAAVLARAEQEAEAAIGARKAAEAEGAEPAAEVAAAVPAGSLF